MELEWDEEKRLATLEQRGIDFADIPLFEPESCITWPDVRRDYGEPRFITMGILHDVPCSYCWTPRDGKIRIISLRKINDRERKIYQEARLRSSHSE